MLLALAEHEVLPDVIVGTSVGAVNAAWVASWPGFEGAQHLAEIWMKVRRNDIFPIRPITGFRGFAGHNNYLVNPRKFRSLLESNLTYSLLEDAPVPVKVVTTELSTGLEVVLDRGSVVDAVSASAAIPGIFPPVTINGRRLVDGGIANDAPISHAVDFGASTVYVLPTGYACSLRSLPKSALGAALQAISLLTHQRLVADIERYRGVVDLRVFPALCPMNVSPLDFSQTGTLIEKAHMSASRWLDAFDKCDLAPSASIDVYKHEFHNG